MLQVLGEVGKSTANTPAGKLREGWPAEARANHRDSQLKTHTGMKQQTKDSKVPHNIMGCRPEGVLEGDSESRRQTNATTQCR